MTLLTSREPSRWLSRMLSPILVRETREKIGRGMWVCWEQDSETLSSKKLEEDREKVSQPQNRTQSNGEKHSPMQNIWFICTSVISWGYHCRWQDLHFASADRWCHHRWLIKCWLTSYRFTSCWHLLVSSQLGVHCQLFVLVDELGASLLPPIFSF